MNRQYFKPISIFILFTIMSIKMTEAKPLPSPFNNYRLSIGAGLGYSPLILLAPAPFKYLPWQNIKPSLKAEFTIDPKYSINIGFQNERYKFNINPLIEYYTTNDQNRDSKEINSKASANMQYLTIDIRKYSFFSGYIAPYGRYVMYGLSFNNTLFKNEAIAFSINDDQNGQLNFEYPAHQYWIKTTGFRMGLGKKKYLGTELKSFIEYQMHLDIKIGDFGSGLGEGYLPKYGGINRVTYETAMRLSQMTSLFQFNFTYGFSL
ncbi:MAG: hypothetical protein IT245_02595 [Bacteroidia bacterium]|nr:hypothetical protein [Bacteroidia bacterium]